jgi:D-alanyl-D-alanine carboxypeptidase/D-alanyl-D-alanine-endopeptidase (penicillin-binding protein 4)
MRVHLRGQIPVNGSGLLVNHAVEDPAAFARSLFIDALRGEGVAVDVSPLGTAHALLPEWDSYARDKPLAVFTSPPLAEAIKVTLKVSHNLYASTLPLLLAARHHKRTLAEGLRLQREVLSTLGVDVDSVSFGGGAGGNNADSVTPRAAVQVLRGMAAKQPDAYPAYLAALPRLGVDGTLADAVPKDSPARDKVQAKTGTLTWQDLLNDRPLLRSKALAGVLTNAKGKPYTFALYVNDVPLPRDGSSRREGKQLGKVCEVLYQHTP